MIRIVTALFLATFLLPSLAGCDIGNKQIGVKPPPKPPIPVYHNERALKFIDTLYAQQGSVNKRRNEIRTMGKRFKAGEYDDETAQKIVDFLENTVLKRPTGESHDEGEETEEVKEAARGTISIIKGEAEPAG